MMSAKRCAIRSTSCASSTGPGPLVGLGGCGIPGPTTPPTGGTDDAPLELSYLLPPSGSIANMAGFFSPLPESGFDATSVDPVNPDLRCSALDPLDVCVLGPTMGAPSWL